MNSARVLGAFLLAPLLLPVLPCLAQIGQNPIPVPGSPPITRNPGKDQQSVGHTKKDKKGKTIQEDLPTITFEGFTLKNDGKEILVHTADGRWIKSSLSTETKWLQNAAPIDAAKIIPGTTVMIEAAEEGDYSLTAVTIQLTKEVTPEQKADSEAKPKVDTQPDDAQLTSATKPIGVPDAPDRPKMSHRHSVESGIQSVNGDTPTASVNPNEAPESPKDTPEVKSKPVNNEQQDFTIGTDTPLRTASKGGPGSQVLQRSMNWAETFDQGLPNYLCREVITRYIQQTRSDDWAPQDVVTANIVYQDGREDQRDVMVGNKKVSDITKTGGTWSTGEFATMLHSLFQPTRDTDFKYDRAGVIHDIDTAEFDYAVILPNSDWTIDTGAQILRPKYTGTLWIEKNSGVVRRLEQEAKNIPKDFPLDEVQSMIEYEEVSLGAQKFLLPVRAENIACQRSSSVCSKNVIEFRDYHKFSGESTIQFK